MIAGSPLRLGEIDSDCPPLGILAVALVATDIGLGADDAHGALPSARPRYQVEPIAFVCGLILLRMLTAIY